jgi:hypothetical protein
MRESIIESYLVQEVERRGGICEKHVSPGRRSVPDRLVTWRGVMDLVETKAPGEKARKDQERDHERRADLGILVWLLDTHAKVDAYIQSRHHVWPHAPKPVLSKPDLSQLELPMKRAPCIVHAYNVRCPRCE